MEKRVFSTTLQSLRKEKKVTQEQLAQKLGVSPQAVSKWENGSYPEGDLLPAIADFFDVSIDYLYGRSDGEKTIEQKVFEAVYDSTCKEFEDTGRADEIPETGCNLTLIDVDRRGTNPVRDFGLLLKYFKYIKRIKPDIVLTYTIKPNVYGGLACRLTGTPYAANVTGLGTAFEGTGILRKNRLLFTSIR